MSRARTFLTIVIPSMLAGGLIFSSAFTRADAGPDAALGFWPAAGQLGGTTLAQAAPTPPVAPRPPAPPAPAPAAPPAPPAPPRHTGSGVSVTIKDGKVDISGVDELVSEQLENAKKSIESSPLPADVKAKLRAKLDRTRAIIGKRLANTKNLSPEQLGEEMGKLGEEIGKEMEGFGDEMERFGEQMDKQFGNLNVHVHSHHKKGSAHDDDDDDDDDTAGVPMAPDVDIDADDDGMKEAIKDLGDLALKPAQRDAITKLRKDSDKTVGDAKKQLDQLASKLHDALGNAAITDADVAKYVDQISAQEAAIRKARLLAWVNARRVLDDAQRKKVEDAAKKKTK